MNATIEKEDLKKEKLDINNMTLNHVKLVKEDKLVNLTM